MSAGNQSSGERFGAGPEGVAEHPDKTIAVEGLAAQEGNRLRLGRYLIAAKLGEGGFGIVYRACDEELRRDVAIKVPHRERLTKPGAAEAFLAEARTLASLDHPHIVPVHDMGRTEDGLCYVVSKFIEGSDLAARIEAGPLPWLEGVEIVAAVAEALHHAHMRGLVHRDVKPANILIDVTGKPFVADFGLALREDEYGKRGAGICGTPAYMSPEQANGEGHRVDGRSDIFSLGVVFYELLTGRRPFRGEMTSVILQIVADEPRPPRQIDDTIPRELERICLKALSKRASDRYTTAKDMAEELRLFLSRMPAAERLTVTRRGTIGDEAATATVGPSATPSDQRAIKIVPKGLRSFDSGDADFFLELVPGPRDFDGLPDSIRFWKARIETLDADSTFSVGLIYGPSGCGKSSLVRAGLLPRLSKQITTLYVEATADETEARLQSGLRKRCPGLPADEGLKETLAALRRSEGLPQGQKVLIVLDQFEQWLHAAPQREMVGALAKKGPDTFLPCELVQALRQCDGEHVQCILMVRDDFWMAATRFMRELEIRLVEGQNSAAVDLFSTAHAERVLAAFGRAFGVLPDSPGAAGNDQKQFLQQAVRGLAQDNGVVCVRLALFAEMMKGRPWTPASLQEVGGTEGVGVTFLEETFSAAGAPPENRYHQKAARSVLAALLPESGSEIRGHMRSYAELLEASGYTGHPKEFDDLLGILDGEIRLITPTDPAGIEASADSTLAEGSRPNENNRYYQLTHDYLVPAMRDWLTRKQKETRKGRAELLLEDRAAVWNARKENRQLPSLPQWLQIRLLTQRRRWSELERRMMRKAGRYHAVRGLIIVAILGLLGWAGWEGLGRMKAHDIRERVLECNTAEVAGVVKDMAPYRRWVDPLLRQAYDQAERDGDERKQLHASIALLPVDPGQVDYLYVRLLAAEPEQLLAIREALAPHKNELSESMWRFLLDPANEPEQRFRVACALASYVPDDGRWEKVNADVAARLVAQNALALASWADLLAPVGKQLLPPLASFLQDEKRNGTERNAIANLYGRFAREQADAFARLEKVLAESAEPNSAVEARTALAKRRANVGVALVVMGRGEKAWPLLEHSRDPTLRSYLIDRLATGGVDSKVLIKRLDDDQDISIKRALLLSLGELSVDRLSVVGPTVRGTRFNVDRLAIAEPDTIIRKVLQLYRDDPDPGIHGAAEWLLRQWGADAKRKALDTKLATGAVEDKRRWYVNRQGQTMVVLPAPGECWLGEGQSRHQVRIDRSFAIAVKDVTVEQFLAFRGKHPYFPSFAPTKDCPVNNVTWYEAAEYCNWLSEKEGLEPDQWCYRPNKDAKYADGMTMAPGYLRRTGYRLPTAAEWEFACRSNAATAYAFGDADDLLDRYGWYSGNSTGKSHPVGMLRPNDFGLFDMHGNVWQWTLDRQRRLSGAETVRADAEDPDDSVSIDNLPNRSLYGGNFGIEQARCTTLIERISPDARIVQAGLRVARTVR